jgi:hypothetical protein
MATVVYECPNTGFRVQGYTVDDKIAPDLDVYAPATCLACKLRHFVNLKTGEVLIQPHTSSGSLSMFAAILPAHPHRSGIKHRCEAFIAASYQEPAMRLLLIIVGAFAAIVCIEKSAEAQNGAWCLYINGDGDGEPHCRYATFEQCLADRLGSNSCGPSPYPSSPQSPPSTRLRRR